MASTSGGQNPHGHGGRRSNSGRKKVLNPGSGMKQERGGREEEFGSKKISTSPGIVLILRGDTSSFELL